MVLFYIHKIIYVPIPAQIPNDYIVKLVNAFVSKLNPYKEFIILNRVHEKQKLIPGIADYDMEDPQRYLWGGKPEVNDRKL